MFKLCTVSSMLHMLTGQPAIGVVRNWCRVVSLLAKQCGTFVAQFVQNHMSSQPSACCSPAFSSAG